MKIGKFFILTTTLLTLFSIEGLWAQAARHQDAAIAILESPQYMATQGSFHSAADDFISPDTYTDAKIEKLFAYTSWDSWEMATLGLALNIKGIHIGAYYGGNFWSGITEFNPSTRYVQNWPSGGKTVPVYDRPPELLYSSNTSRFAILVGALNMGFRFQYGTTWQSHKEENDFAVIGAATGNGFYKNSQTAFGVISPQIEWAMAKPFLSNGIQPYASVTVNIARDYFRSEGYVTDGTSEGEQIHKSANYVNPVIDVAAGGYDFYNVNNLKFSVDFDYQLDTYIYSNDYSYRDSSNKYKIKQINGINTGSSLSADRYTSNRFRPMLEGAWSGGPVGVKAKFNLPITVVVTEKLPMRVSTDGNGKLEWHGTYVKSSAVDITPSLELGVQFKIAGDKLFLNAGGKIETEITRGTENNTSYQDDEKEENSDVKTPINKNGNTSAALSLGITVNPTKNISLEATCGIEGDNSIDVFKSGGLFSFSRILISLKF